MPVATRITPEHLEQIEQLAARLDVPVSALIRGWILAGLEARTVQTVDAAINRLADDLQRLREIVA